MNRALLLSLLLIVSIVFASCTVSKQHTLPERLFVAWNEDTAKSYLLTLFKNDRFYYEITRNDSLGKIQNIYQGTYKLTDQKVFLFYEKNQPANGMSPFLKLEVTGNYLIQPFTNSYAKEFLRLPRSSPHGMYY